MRERAPLVNTISRVCGTNLTDYGVSSRSYLVTLLTIRSQRRLGPVQLTFAVKDIGDSLIFDRVIAILGPVRLLMILLISGRGF